MKRAHVKYILGLLLFGLNGIVSNQIALSSYEIVVFRTFFGSLFLLVLYLEMKGKWNLLEYPKELLFLILSGISMGASWIFLYEAYQRIGVGLSSIAYYCGPVIVMLVTPLVFRMKFTGRQIFCFCVVFVGILLISVPGSMGNAQMDKFGLFCGFASAVLPVDTVSILGYLEPLSAVVFAVLLLRERLSLWEITGAVMILAGAIFTILSKRTPQESRTPRR